MIEKFLKIVNSSINNIEYCEWMIKISESKIFYCVDYYQYEQLL